MKTLNGQPCSSGLSSSSSSSLLSSSSCMMRGSAPSAATSLGRKHKKKAHSVFLITVSTSDRTKHQLKAAVLWERKRGRNTDGETGMRAERAHGEWSVCEYSSRRQKKQELLSLSLTTTQRAVTAKWIRVYGSAGNPFSLGRRGWQPLTVLSNTLAHFSKKGNFLPPCVKGMDKECVCWRGAGDADRRGGVQRRAEGCRQLIYLSCLCCSVLFSTFIFNILQSLVLISCFRDQLQRMIMQD